MSTRFNPFSLYNTTEKPDSTVLNIHVESANGTVHKLNTPATLIFERDASQVPDIEEFDLRPKSAQILY